MLIEHGDPEQNLEAMIERDHCNKFYMSRREQNHLNSAPFVDKKVKAIRESECLETLIVFEEPSHRMDQYVSTIAQAIAESVDSDHPILAVCVPPEKFQELRKENYGNLHNR